MVNSKFFWIWFYKKTLTRPYTFSNSKPNSKRIRLKDFLSSKQVSTFKIWKTLGQWDVFGTPTFFNFSCRPENMAVSCLFLHFFSWLIFEAFLYSNQGFDFGTWRHFLEARQNKADLYRNGLVLSRKIFAAKKYGKKLSRQNGKVSCLSGYQYVALLCPSCKQTWFFRVETTFSKSLLAWIGFFPLKVVCSLVLSSKWKHLKVRFLSL